MEELNKFLLENEIWQREHRAKMYSQKCRKKRKIIIDWKSQECGMWLLATALLFALATMIL